MNALEIIGDYLKTNGFDGLYNRAGECGCEVGGLSPGDCLVDECEAAYKVPCDPANCPADGNCDWHMSPRRESCPKD